MLVFALLAHGEYSSVEANNELCVSLNTTVSFRNGTSEGSFDAIDGMTGDYCQDLMATGYGGRAGQKFFGFFSIWLVFTQVSPGIPPRAAHMLAIPNPDQTERCSYHVYYVSLRTSCAG